MFMTPGTLHVSRRSGRRGAFSVAILSTPIGEFNVKDSQLDQFDPGSYPGQFGIERVFTASNVWRNSLIVEMRAEVSEMIVDAALPTTPSGQRAAATTPTAEASADPLDEATLATTAGVVVSQVDEAHAVAVLPTSDSVALPTESDATSTLAGSAFPDAMVFDVKTAQLINARATIKLDPTVDREQFRKQRDLLKALGYQFDPKQQHWVYIVISATESASASPLAQPA